MKLEEAKKKLTEREYSFLEAMLAGDQAKLRSFGDDAVLLAKNVEYKILAAGGIEEGPSSVSTDVVQLTLFETPKEEPEVEVPPAPSLPDQKLADAAEKLSKSNFKSRGDNQVVVPPVPEDNSILPQGELDGLERKEDDGLALGEFSKQTDVLDEVHVGHAPFRKGDVVRGDRVMFKASGAIHRVKGVDRTTDPHTIKIEVFGKVLEVSRELVAKIAPTNYDRRWQRRRGWRRTGARFPTQYTQPEPTAQDGYDPQDRSE